jgi:uncharacterized membrane protein YukC
VILPFKLSKNLIIIKKAKFNKTILSGLALLIIVVYIFLVISYFSD